MHVSDVSTGCSDATRAMQQQDTAHKTSRMHNAHARSLHTSTEWTSTERVSCCVPGCCSDNIFAGSNDPYASRKESLTSHYSANTFLSENVPTPFDEDGARVKRDALWKEGKSCVETAASKVHWINDNQLRAFCPKAWLKITRQGTYPAQRAGASLECQPTYSVQMVGADERNQAMCCGNFAARS